MKLSKRLAAIASFVPFDAYIADVGSDHCALPIALIKEGRIKKAVAIENKKGPFMKMRQAVDESGCANDIECSFSDGISALPIEVDTIVIAGMGGKQIIDILAKHQNRLCGVDTIVIDAHRDVPYAIESLAALGFRMSDEDVVLDAGVYYDIQKWERGCVERPYSAIELKYGPVNVQKRSPMWKSYLQGKIEAIGKTLINENLPPARAEALQNEIDEIEAILKE